MDKPLIEQLKTRFDALAQSLPAQDVEFWFARDLQEPLGYARWENFLTAIERAISSCRTKGFDPDNHFRGVTKMVACIRAAARGSRESSRLLALGAR